MVGLSAQREVFLGFASARLLYALSFADVLDEDTKRGYQRRLNAAHSADFRRYIQLSDSATIPLTFNLRKREDDAWQLHRNSVNGAARLVLAQDRGKLLTQVDCQHRLGHLQDVDVMLPIMCFLNLSEREEMEIFNVINSKAKGLCSSLLDFHDATLARDLASERPELFIALLLNDNEDSPWYQQLKLGGTTTSGLKRRASLRTMQKAVKSFLNQTRVLKKHQVDVVGRMVIDFWLRSQRFATRALGSASAEPPMQRCRRQRAHGYRWRSGERGRRQCLRQSVLSKQAGGLRPRFRLDQPWTAGRLRRRFRRKSGSGNPPASPW